MTEIGAVVIRFPRRRMALSGATKDHGERGELADFDAELRTIDQATKALAERKKGVLVKYRQVLRRLGGSQILLLVLICAGTPQKHCRRSTAYAPAVCYQISMSRRQRRSMATGRPT